jgi:hypothetical protein
MNKVGDNHKKMENSDEVQFFSLEQSDLSEAYDEMIALYTMLPPHLCKIKRRVKSGSKKNPTANND